MWQGWILGDIQVVGFAFRIGRSAGMSRVEERECWVLEHAGEYLRGLGFALPLEDMEGARISER